MKERNNRVYLVSGDDKVRLQTHFVALWERRVDFGAVRVVHAEGDTGALEECLEEELSVECERRRVEGDCLVARDERVRTRNGVRDEQVHQFSWGETTIFHAAEDRFYVTLGQWDCVVICRNSCMVNW